VTAQVGLTDPVSITISVIGFFIVLVLFVFLRLVLRREPSPISWRRFRIGFFVERDSSDPDDPE
jgi:hypothetical protein